MKERKSVIYIEQFLFRVRSVDCNLDLSENFIGFYVLRSEQHDGGNDQESLHKPLLSNQKQLIVRDTR